MSHSAEILLKGQKVVFRHSDTDSPENFNGAIELAAGLIRNAEARSPLAASHQIALLALVDLAAQYLQAKERTVQYQRKLQEKSQAISDLL